MANKAESTEHFTHTCTHTHTQGWLQNTGQQKGWSTRTKSMGLGLQPIRVCPGSGKEVRKQPQSSNIAWAISLCSAF